VTTVEIPANLSEAQNYPTQLCGFGQFRLLQPALFGGPSVCPNGLGKLFNKCFQPVIVDAAGNASADCLARRFPVQGIGANGMDGRAYNLPSKNPNGTYRTDNLGRFVTGAFYRVHTTETIAAGAQVCRKGSATDQIGCLTQANPCSIGFAGREAALSVNGLPPTVANIEALVLTASTADDYVLSRKLYFNTLKGFQDPLLRDGEYELARCMGRGSLVGPVANNRGFVAVPGGVRCEDFNESVCPGAPANVNACGDNPPDLLSL
jgi:hypothetical protein